MVCVYTMEYYLAIRKEDSATCKKKWMELEGIMLGEINQAEKDTVWLHLHVESKKTEHIDTENRLVVAKGWAQGEKDDRRLAKQVKVVRKCKHTVISSGV